MSKKEKVTEQKEQKVVTKYDRKMQKREEQKKREAREELREKIIVTIVVLAVVGIFAYFPISNQIKMTQTYINVGGEDISKLEFDYNYNVLKNNYVNQNAYMMSLYGIDLTGDLTTQMYSETMTWQDYFEQMAVDNLVQTKALKAQADAAGFTYDTTEEYKEFKDSIKATAAEAGVSTNNYVQAIYGTYATLGRISDFIKEDIRVGAYYEQIAEEKAPADEEVQAYYESNKDDYESVDYRMTTVVAEIPTETTPTEEEIQSAMADALKQAEEAEKKVKTEGELQENVTKAYANSTISGWLFDSTRKAGDTTLIEDTINNQYYVLAFEKRYLDETPSADVRIIVSEDKAGQEILDEWKALEATEDSFSKLCEKYSVDATATDGGMYEAVIRNTMPEEVDTWLFDQTHVAGDTVAIVSEDGSYQYVLYYVGQNDPEWKLNIKSILLTEIMDKYLTELEADIQVSDPDGNLNYLKVQETESDTAESEEGTEESATEGSEAAEESVAESSEAAN